MESSSEGTEDDDDEARGAESSSEAGDARRTATRARYDGARTAIERAMTSDGDGEENGGIAARCRACAGTLLLSGTTLRAHAKSKKHLKNLAKLGKANDENFVCFYPAVREDDGYVSDGEAETHAERLARLRAQKILRDAGDGGDAGGKFSLAQFDSSDDDDGDDDDDYGDDDERVTKRLARKEFARKARDMVADKKGEDAKRSRRHAQRKRKGKSKPGKRQRMAMKTEGA